MTPLAIVIAGADQARLDSALRLAAAQAALGGAVTVFFDSPAVALLGATESESGALIDTCLALGGTVMVCQTGLAEAGLRADALDPRLLYGGMVGFLAGADAARLVVV